MSETKVILPAQDGGTDGKYLKSNGDVASWQPDTADEKVIVHNTSETAHTDIRAQLSAIEARLDALESNS